MVLYETDYIHITYKTETGTLCCVWVGRQTEEGIKSAGAIIIKIIEEKSVKKILNDNRQVKGSWKDVAGWVNEEWFPAIIRAGVTHFAWILSTNIFARYSARKAAGKTKIIKSFTKEDEATRWLEKG